MFCYRRIAFHPAPEKLYMKGVSIYVTGLIAAGMSSASYENIERIMNMISLVEMKVNRTGIIKSLGEGVQFQAKMNSLNVRIGKKLKKISNSILKGPVVVEVDNTRVAIGWGMAKKVFLEVIDENSPHG